MRRLEVSGRSTTDLPYARRRELLEELELTVGRVQVPPYWTDVDPSNCCAQSKTRHAARR
ncbi:hypothetical protein ACQP1O_22430 [Nocardia sp. CA-151230]|uniref:hypothetical protein n=1 Tax=Nocardia sp. CA-151230 TaxID=3239982 RepID=UPI003D8B1DC2